MLIYSVNSTAITGLTKRSSAMQQQERECCVRRTANFEHNLPQRSNVRFFCCIWKIYITIISNTCFRTGGMHVCRLFVYSFSFQISCVRGGEACYVWGCTPTASGSHSLSWATASWIGRTVPNRKSTWEKHTYGQRITPSCCTSIFTYLYVQQIYGVSVLGGVPVSWLGCPVSGVQKAQFIGRSHGSGFMVARSR